MTDHRELLAAIAARAALDPRHAAKQPAESILVCVARRLDEPGREALASTLPHQLAVLVRDAAPLRDDKGRTPFLQTVASARDLLQRAASPALPEPTDLTVVEERPDGTAFRVWTHARGVVTDLDVELARRISEVIEET